MPKLVYTSETGRNWQTIVKEAIAQHGLWSQNEEEERRAFTIFNSETVAVLRRMNMFLDDYNGQMIPGDECRLNFLTFVLQLRKNFGRNLNQEVDPTGGSNPGSLDETQR